MEEEEGERDQERTGEGGPAPAPAWKGAGLKGAEKLGGEPEEGNLLGGVLEAGLREEGFPGPLGRVLAVS